MVLCKRLWQRTRKQDGLSLLELLLALTVLGITIVPIIKVFMLTTKLTNYSTKELQASQLAQDLMEEIVSLPYADPQSPNSFGCEEIPVQPAGGRFVFDDIDDYAIYTQENKYSWQAQRPPRDITGKQISASDQYSRKATIYEYVNLFKGQISTSHSTLHEPLKLVVVTVRWNIHGSKADSLRLYRLVAK